MESRFTIEELDFFKELLSTVAPSGFENETSHVIEQYLKDSCNLEYDIMGNLYAFNNTVPQSNGLMLTAHIDEVGFQITRFTNSGMAYVRKLGGLDRQTLPGTTLVIAGKSRDIIGVFGKNSPHIQETNEKSQILQLDSLWVDFGFDSREEIIKYVSIGDFVGILPSFHFSVSGNSIISKGLDNKVSAFILAVALKRLAATKGIPKHVTNVFTVQEEIGCRGAIVATNRLTPEKAICLDVGVATDIPSMKTNTSLSELFLHKGPGLCVAPDNNVHMIKALVELASHVSLPYQITTGLRATGGTETSKIQIECSGVATAHISIPNRYMHSAVEMCSLTDAYNAMQLAMEIMSVF